MEHMAKRLGYCVKCQKPVYLIHRNGKLTYVDFGEGIVMHQRCYKNIAKRDKQWVEKAVQEVFDLNTSSSKRV